MKPPRTRPESFGLARAEERGTFRAVGRSWALVLTRSGGDPRRRVGGLPVALRLALDAQRAGAVAIVVDETSDVTPASLSDPRLRIPVGNDAPPGARRVVVGASVVVHRDVLRAVAERGHGDVVTVDETAPPASTPFTFPPIDVVDAASASRAERALFRSLRKPQDGWTSRWLNRYISLTLSRWLVKTPLAPNQVSVGILAVGLYGA